MVNNINTYTLVLKRLTSQGKIPVFSFDVNAQDNMMALMDGQQCVCNFLGSEGYELMDAGMMVSGDTLERNMIFMSKDDEMIDFVLYIVA